MSKHETYYPCGYGETRSERCIGSCMYGLSMAAIVISFPISVWFCITIIREYQRIVILRVGRLQKKRVKGPGVVFLIPCLDEYQKVDLRTDSIDVPVQETMTKDSASIQVNAVVYYRISDPLAAVMAVADYRYSTELLAMTTFRNLLGQKTLSQVLSDRLSISKELFDFLDEGTDRWGITVERVEILEVTIPESTKRLMAVQAEAEREAKAKFIEAEGELDSAKTLKEASDVMATSPNALTLRFLQTMSEISNEQTETVVIPLPMDLIRRWLDIHR